MTKEEYLKQLRENEFYKKLLEAATSMAERRAISAHTEDFMMKFYKNVVDPINKLKEKDPDFIKNGLSQLKQDLIMSGSKDK